MFAYEENSMCYIKKRIYFTDLVKSNIKNDQKQHKCLCKKLEKRLDFSLCICPVCLNLFVLQVLAAVLPVSGTSQEARW